MGWTKWNLDYLNNFSLHRYRNWLAPLQKEEVTKEFDLFLLFRYNELMVKLPMVFHKSIVKWKEKYGAKCLENDEFLRGVFKTLYRKGNLVDFYQNKSWRSC